MPGRRALLIGIDKYKNRKISQLHGCVADATSMRDILMTNEDGGHNYDCRLFTSPGSSIISRAFLRDQWVNLFASFKGDILFYFSGHGTPTHIGGFLVTQDASSGDYGLPMDELLVLANKSSAREVLLILDCCFSGLLGNPANLQGSGNTENQAQLREGVTILAASRPTEPAMEIGGHGVFTKLLLSALTGGAADVRGRVSAAAAYAYVEQALGSWDQRPLYKSHANRLSPIRNCNPAVADGLLRELPDLFSQPTSSYALNPSFEHTHPSASPQNVAIFNKFKIFRNARLLRTIDVEDLYFAALNNKTVALTPIGKLYWQLAKDKRL